MITDEDLPKPWRVVASPIDPKRATQLEEAAGTDAEAEDPVSWDLIENADTGRQIMLRMAQDETGVVLSGLYVPGPAPVGIGELRTLPLASIEAAARGRVARMGALVQAALIAGPDEQPLGRPESPDDREFYARLALRYMRVAESSTGPASDLAKAEGVTARTVQRWTARARELGLLPPGRRGKYS